MNFVLYKWRAFEFEGFALVSEKHRYVAEYVLAVGAGVGGGEYPLAGEVHFDRLSDRRRRVEEQQARVAGSRVALQTHRSAASHAYRAVCWLQGRCLLFAGLGLFVRGAVALRRALRLKNPESAVFESADKVRARCAECRYLALVDGIGGVAPRLAPARPELTCSTASPIRFRKLGLS